MIVFFLADCSRYQRASPEGPGVEEIGTLADREEIGLFDGVLLDLGVSSMQLDETDRGFSFRRDAALDMRMDASDGPSAADLVAELDERELTRILFEYGEEKRARAIAREIQEAHQLMERLNWRSIDVSYMAVEEIARRVMDLLGLRRRA